VEFGEEEQEAAGRARVSGRGKRCEQRRPRRRARAGSAAAAARLQAAGGHRVGGALQQQPLLRVHQRRLGRRQAKGRRVKVKYAVDKGAEARGDAAGGDLGRVEGVGVPPRVRRHRVQLVAVAHAGVQRGQAAHARRAQRDAGDDQRLGAGAGARRGQRPRRRLRGRRLDGGGGRAAVITRTAARGLQDVARHRGDAGVVKGERRGQLEGKRRRQAVAQLDRAQRVQAGVHQRRVAVDLRLWVGRAG
jgi:hypothetical protein